jgi:hypothetical protein
VIVNGVGDWIAKLRSDRGAFGVEQFNRAHVQAQTNQLARAVEIHGAATVAKILYSFPILDPTKVDDR